MFYLPDKILAEDASTLKTVWMYLGPKTIKASTTMTSPTVNIVNSSQTGLNKIENKSTKKERTKAQMHNNDLGAFESSSAGSGSKSSSLLVLILWLVLLLVLLIWMLLVALSWSPLLSDDVREEEGSVGDIVVAVVAIVGEMTAASISS